jgi:hypothetical protein
MNLDGDQGVLLEVDLDYPASIHDQTADLPFAPEKMKVDKNHVSDFMHAQYQSYQSRPTEVKLYEKLLLTQWNKTHYVIHGKLLQFFLRHGMILKKVHRGLKFEQSFVFREYISFNSRKRQEATNKFEKEFFKLKNNALYGKLEQNVRRYMNFRLCNTDVELAKYASKPAYNGTVRFSQDLVGVKLMKEVAFLDRPIIIGQAVLDLAKLEMYELYYDHLKGYEQQFPDSHISVVGGKYNL